MGGEKTARILLALVNSWVIPAGRIVEMIRDRGAGYVESLGVEGLVRRFGLDATARHSLQEALERAPEIELELSRIGAVPVYLGTREYPTPLSEIPVPPPVLYVIGHLPSGDMSMIAVVGSRRASISGLRIASDLAADLASRGFTVVSGLARGIDTAAHEGALRVGGRTVAVLGCGIDYVYPPENVDLAGRITARGAVVSELAPGVQPLPWHFPLRNRIISGLTMGTVVVEAASSSGALITAKCALEQNRSVFAVPGRPGDMRSSGVNRLIKDGARLVESAEDIIEEIGPQIGLPLPRSEQPAGDAVQGAGAAASAGERTPADGPERDVIDLLSNVPVHVDEISGCLGVDSGRLLVMLLNMETRGLVKSLPGKFYVRS